MLDQGAGTLPAPPTRSRWRSSRPASPSTPTAMPSSAISRRSPPISANRASSSSWPSTRRRWRQHAGAHARAVRGARRAGGGRPQQARQRPMDGPVLRRPCLFAGDRRHARLAEGGHARRPRRLSQARPGAAHAARGRGRRYRCGDARQGAGRCLRRPAGRAAAHSHRRRGAGGGAQAHGGKLEGPQSVAIFGRRGVAATIPTTCRRSC